MNRQRLKATQRSNPSIAPGTTQYSMRSIRAARFQPSGPRDRRALAHGYRPLLFLFLRIVMPHDATAHGSDYGMVACDVAGHSADHCALQTSRRVRRADGRQ
jgi:hypothetical protein